MYEATPQVLAAATGRGNGDAGAARKELIGGWITEDTIWACTTCGYCTSVCPVFIIPAVDKIIEMRRHLVLEKTEFPKEMQTAFRGMETNGNPWGISAASRADWAEGPAGRHDGAGRGARRSRSSSGSAAPAPTKTAPRSVSRSLVEILNAAGVSFAILGTEETCNGDSARRMGNEYLFQMLAQQNIETMNGYGVKKIVTNCPHCFNCLKNEYAAARRQLRGDARHGARRAADRRGARPHGDADRPDDHLPRPVLSRPLQRRVRRAPRRSSNPSPA